VEIAVTAPVLYELSSVVAVHREVYGRLGPVQLFYEVDWNDLTPARLQAFASTPGAGLKVRMGGLSADRFPTASRVAEFLGTWAAHPIPLKATAGLHQVLPHDDSEIKVRQHGFLNLFAAAMLARRHQMSRDDLTAILQQTEAGRFEFDSQGLETLGLRLTTAEVRELREQVLSFGSCSFLEPVGSLVEHGFLELA
ncbi:MAG: hypothetical protein AB1758_10740, partial [Candidatus Eremiobacterota bacterium]